MAGIVVSLRVPAGPGHVGPVPDLALPNADGLVPLAEIVHAPRRLPERNGETQDTS
jgi:hypothetical protein